MSTTSEHRGKSRIFHKYCINWGTRWLSWLRHCATSRKFAGSIPDGVIGIFPWNNSSGRTMALGLTQPLTEISTRNISRGQRRPVRSAENLTTFMCRLSWNLGASTFWNHQGLSRPVMGLILLYTLIHISTYIQKTATNISNVVTIWVFSDHNGIISLSCFFLKYFILKTTLCVWNIL